MNDLDKKISSILSEAMLKFGKKNYFVPNIHATELVMKDGVRMTDNLLNDPSPDSALFVKRLKGFNENLREQAIVIYMEYGDNSQAENPIDVFLRENADFTFNLGDRGKISAPWMKELLLLSDNARSGAVGKGEILASVLGNGEGISQSAEGGADVHFDNGDFSVKFAEDPNGPWKLNGILGNFKDALRKELTVRLSVLAEDTDVGKSSLIAMLAKNSFNQEDIIAAVIKDAKLLRRSAQEVMEQFMLSADESLKQIEKDTRYILFTNGSYVVTDTSGMQFSSVDSQSKVVIQRKGTSGGLRQLAKKIQDPNKESDPWAGEAEAADLKGEDFQEFVKSVKGMGTTLSSSATGSSKKNKAKLRADILAVSPNEEQKIEVFRDEMENDDIRKSYAELAGFDMEQFLLLPKEEQVKRSKMDIDRKSKLMKSFLEKKSGDLKTPTLTVDAFLTFLSETTKRRKNVLKEFIRNVLN